MREVEEGGEEAVVESEEALLRRGPEWARLEVAGVVGQPTNAHDAWRESR